MATTSFAYRALIRLGAAVAPAVSARRPKLQEGLAGRAGVLPRLESWARAHRDAARSLLWMHASSVGEGLQAEAVLRHLRADHPDWQVAYTYFSPSAGGVASSQPADVADYLPWDRPRDVEIALRALRPTGVVFSKLDLWPELSVGAANRGAAVGLIAATVSPRSRRLRWPSRNLLRPGYQAVALAGAVTDLDAARLVRLGVPQDRITITGDPRFDSALARARAILPDDPLRVFCRGAPTLVAGSTWPEDEEVLLAAFQLLRSARPNARLVLVPHEPSPDHLAGLDHRARAHGLDAPARLSTCREPVPLLVVDRVGVLTSFYADAAIAYVGGGFGAAGLHSVLEPAAAGVVTVFGPRWRGSPDAGTLLHRRAAAVVSIQFPDWLDLDSRTTHAGISPLAALWLAMLRHPDHVRAAGSRGLECVEAGIGAAARNAGLVERLMALGQPTFR